MQFLIDLWEPIRDFLELGGNVLVVIGWTIFFMWVLILERFIFFQTRLKQQAQEVFRTWEARAERTSWEAASIRQALVSQVRLSANAGLPMIKTLVALCPLLGLLGTVTGMVEVFDVMAVTGTGNARAMASGVSKATVPTMAGMVGALSGVLFATILTNRANREVELLEDELTMDH
jgi:biopolymer transport protein ExbB